jgi:hypothetical protein
LLSPGGNIPNVEGRSVKGGGLRTGGMCFLSFLVLYCSHISAQGEEKFLIPGEEEYTVEQKIRLKQIEADKARSDVVKHILNSLNSGTLTAEMAVHIILLYAHSVNM